VRLKVIDVDSAIKGLLRMRVQGAIDDQQSIQNAIRLAAEATQRAFADGVSSGVIKLDQLSRESYELTSGSKRKQFRNRSLHFLERVPPPIQVPMLAVDPTMAFYAAVDRNGWPAVHNNVHSQ
jgi:methyl-accepting chemotaxis protein